MDRSIKVLSVSVIAVLVCAGLVGIFNFSEAVDVSSDPLQDLSLVVGADVNDVMWAPDGTWGLAVGTAGRVWEIDYDTDYTSFPSTASDGSDTWNALDWDPGMGASGGFWVVGDGSGNGATNVYTYQKGGPLTQATATPGGLTEILEGVAYDPLLAGSYLVVGNDGANPVSYYYNGAYGGPLTGVGIVANNVFTDVAYAGGGVDNFIITGYNTVASNTGMTFYATGSNLQGGTYTAENMFNSTLANSEFYAVSWSPDAAADYGLVVGNSDSVHTISGTGANTSWIHPNFLITPNYVFYDVKFDTQETNPEEALIVGGDGTNAAVLKYVDHGGAKTLYEVTGSPIGGTGAPLNCVAFKTYASPRYGITFGNTFAYMVNNIESGQPITTSTLYPHIDDMQAYINFDAPVGNTSVLNRKVDVDTGAQSEVVSIYLDTRHNEGWGNVDYVDITLWWDGGDVGSDSVTNRPGTGTDTDNTFTEFRYTNGGSFTQPNPGNSEIELIGGEDRVIDANNHTIIFNFVFNKQAWASTGEFNDVAGAKAADQTDDAVALNGAYTWDIEAYIEGTTGGQDTRYDEIGVYIYEEFSSSGLPGVYTGSGPPGSVIPLSTSGRNYANFSANYNYSFGVYITDDMYGANPANVIDVDAYGSTMVAGVDGVAVAGGDLDDADIDNGYNGRYYFNTTGSNGVIYILGDTWDTAPTAGNWVTPNTAGNYTTTGGTGLNAARNGAVTEAMYFQTQVNSGIAEDNYQGTLVYLLQHE